MSNYLSRSLNISETGHVISRNEVVFIATLGIIVVTWLLNCIIIGGILQAIHKSKSTPGIYLFVGSQSVAALLNTTLNIPAGIISSFFGDSLISSFTRIYCIFSVFLETFFCNLSFLHAFCSGLDSYIRLNRPKSYLQSSLHHSSIWLKIISPWMIASIQTMLQMSLSNKDTAMLNSSDKGNATNDFLQVCIISESNFIIIRTSIAYIFPLIACLVITGLQLHALKRIPQLDRENILALIKVKCQYPLFNPKVLGPNELPEYQCTLNGNGRPQQSNYYKKSQSSYMLTSGNCQSISQSMSAYNFHKPIQEIYNNNTVEVKPQHLTLGQGTKLKTISERPEVRPIWLQAYKLEQVTVGVNMINCIASIISWSPLILSILTLILCELDQSRDVRMRRRSCLIQSSSSLVGKFRWWNYATSGLLMPMVLLSLDGDLRRSCLKAISCWDNSDQKILPESPTRHLTMKDVEQMVHFEANLENNRMFNSKLRPSKTLPAISQELRDEAKGAEKNVWLTKA